MAALAAGGAAGALGPDQAAAGAGLERQVDAGAQLHVVDVVAVAAHVLAVGDALAQPAQQSPVLGTERVDQGHRLLRGWARRGGWRGGVRRRRAPPAVAAVEPLQASSVCGVMARQGRCVAEAGVGDAASRGREQARRGVGMPARVVSLAAVRI